MGGQGAAPKLGAGISSPGTDHAMRNLTDVNTRARSARKKKKIHSGLKNAQEIHKLVSKTETDQNVPVQEIRDLYASIDELQQNLQRCNILVGVRGVTGAGKSHLFNSLLGEPNGILPVSPQEASTATACHISWNYDDNPLNKYRAEVTFRNLEDVTRDVQDFINAVQRYQELEELIRSRPDNVARSEEDYGELDELDVTIQEFIQTWGEILDLDVPKLKEQEDISAAKVINNRAVSGLLGTTHTITAAEAETFSEEIKPYLDTSPTADYGVVWPMVESVRLYVKSKILENGTELVDLPGASDRVESRARVAESLAKKMDLTILVLPCPRAPDEKTGIGLMNDSLELELKMAGNFHKGAFCIVISKIDDANVTEIKAAHKKDKALDKYTKEEKADEKELNELHSKLNKEEKKLVPQEKKVEKAFEKLQELIRAIPKAKRDKVTDEKLDKLKTGRTEARNKHKEQIRARDKISQEIASCKEKKAELDIKILARKERQLHRSRYLRSQYQEKRLQDGIKKHHEAIRREFPKLKRYDGTVDIFPVSSRAYLNLLRGEPEPLSAFPSEKYTGIPRLCQWIEERTFELREKHIDSILSSLERMLGDTKRWCGDQGGEKFHFPHGKVNQILDSTSLHNKSKINMVLIKQARDMTDLVSRDNTENREKICAEAGYRKAVQWGKKYPDEPGQREKIHWKTYQAILRQGGKFQSSSKGKVAYDWPADLSNELLEQCLGDWLRLFDVIIPQLRDEVCGNIANIWIEYLTELERRIETTAPDLVGPFSKLVPDLKNISRELVSQVKADVDETIKQARKTRDVFVNSIKHNLGEICSGALPLTGEGSFEKRKSHVCKSVEKNMPKMLKEASKSAATARISCVENLRKSGDRIATNMFRAAKAKINILFKYLDAGTSETQIAANEGGDLQRAIRFIALDWETSWDVPEISTLLLEEEDLDIPEEYVEPPPRCAESDSEDVVSDVVSDVDSDMDEKEGDVLVGMDTT